MELAYIAGYFDGEGYIGWGGTLRIAVTNTFRPQLDWLAGVYGGKVRVMHHKYDQRRSTFQWNVDGQNARFFLTDIAPYLREKWSQADLALGIHSRPPSERGPLVDKLKALKRVDYA